MNEFLFYVARIAPPVTYVTALTMGLLRIVYVSVFHLVFSCGVMESDAV
jgi:hypothetical protein